MKLKDGLPSIPEVSEVPAFVLRFREIYPLLEDETIWKIVMWFHPELHGQKTLGDTFVLREDAVRAALAEVRHWRFPSSDAGWSISADEFFLSSQGDVLAQHVLFVEQEPGTSSAPSTPSPPPTPGQKILPLGEMFQEHQDIHMEVRILINIFIWLWLTVGTHRTMRSFATTGTTGVSILNQNGQRSMFPRTTQRWSNTVRDKPCHSTNHTMTISMTTTTIIHVPSTSSHTLSTRIRMPNTSILMPNTSSLTHNSIKHPDRSQGDAGNRM